MAPLLLIPPITYITLRVLHATLVPPDIARVRQAEWVLLLLLLVATVAALFWLPERRRVLDQTLPCSLVAVSAIMLLFSTPAFVGELVAGLTVAGPLKRVDVVLVPDGHSVVAQRYAAQLAKQGYADTVVVFGPGPLAEGESSLLVMRLGASAPGGTVGEGRAIAEQAKRRGWRTAIAVTYPGHMIRTLEVFRKATGLQIIPAPVSEDAWLASLRARTAVPPQQHASYGRPVRKLYSRIVLSAAVQMELMHEYGALGYYLLRGFI